MSFQFLSDTHFFKFALGKDVSGHIHIFFFFSKGSVEVNERLTYHFILLSIFYRHTKQTSDALLVYVPCVFILNKNKKTSEKL